MATKVFAKHLTSQGGQQSLQGAASPKSDWAVWSSISPWVEVCCHNQKRT